MKSVLASAALAASLAIGPAIFATSAFANTEYEMGKIIAIDPSAHTVTVDGGKVFTFPATIDLSAFKVGEVVHINFTVDGDKLDGSLIKAN